MRGDIAAHCTERLIRHVIARSEGKTNPPGWIRYELTRRYEDDGTLADLAPHEMPEAAEPESQPKSHERQPLSAEEIDAVFQRIAKLRREDMGVTLLLQRFGIPAVTTFLVREAGFEENRVRTGIRTRLQKLLEDDFHGRDRLEQILNSTSRREPFPADFLGTDWRRRYADLPWSQEMRRVFDIPGTDEEKSEEGTSEEQGEADPSLAAEPGEDIVTRDSTHPADATPEPARMP
jgi:hypothetical protein